MPIVRITSDSIEPIEATTLTALGLRERADLQQLLKKNIAAIDPDLLLIGEEFGEWADSRRRIDLLAVDRSANLVVIELKRDDDAHMELQALRYAAMIAPLTFDRVAAVYEAFVQREGQEIDARARLLEFLGSDAEEAEPAISDVRIVLVASDFSRELTTTVLWLNERGLDIRCVRLKPYAVGTVLLADVQQLIPLPEAEEYQVSLREKRRQASRSSRPRATVAEIIARLAPDARAAAEEVCRWIESFTPDWRSGAAGFSPILTIDGIDRRFFRIREDGVLVVRFDSLADTPPFDREDVREQLRQRLNTIPGVSIDRISGKPNLPLSILAKPDSMRVLQEAFAWAIESVRRHGTRAR
jgi:hypothetical protein